MNHCSVCGTQIDPVSGYSCNYCTGNYCADHRLPEQHFCPGQGNAVKLGPDMNDSVRTSVEGEDLGVLGLLLWTPIWMLFHLVSFPFRNPKAFGLFFLVVLGAFGIAASMGVVGSDHVDDAVSGVENWASGIGDGPGDGDGGGEPAFQDGGEESNELAEREAEVEIHKAINDRRREHGLEPLEFRQDLASDARAHSQDMVERGYLSHESPDGEGIGDRYPSGCRAIGENIAQTHWRTNVQTSTGTDRIESESELGEAVAEQWMNSPGHRENILRERWDSQGIGIAVSGDEVYVTQGFCG